MRRLFQTCSDVNDGTAMSLAVNDGTGTALAADVDNACTLDHVGIPGEPKGALNTTLGSKATNLSSIISGSASMCSQNTNLALDNK